MATVVKCWLCVRNGTGDEVPGESDHVRIRWKALDELEGM